MADGQDVSAPVSTSEAVPAPVISESAPAAPAPAPTTDPVKMAADSLKAGFGESATEETLTADEKQWGMLAVVSGLVFIIGPVVVLAMKGSTSKFVKFYAMQQLLFQGGMFALNIVLSIVFFVMGAVLSHVPVIGPLIFLMMIPLFGLLGLVMLGLLVFMAMKANNGVTFKLPIIGNIAHNMAYNAK